MDDFPTVRVLNAANYGVPQLRERFFGGVYTVPRPTHAYRPAKTVLLDGAGADGWESASGAIGVKTIFGDAPAPAAVGDGRMSPPGHHRNAEQDGTPRLVGPVVEEAALQPWVGGSRSLGSAEPLVTGSYGKHVVRDPDSPAPAVMAASVGKIAYTLGERARPGWVSIKDSLGVDGLVVLHGANPDGRGARGGEASPTVTAAGARSQYRVADTRPWIGVREAIGVNGLNFKGHQLEGGPRRIPGDEPAPAVVGAFAVMNHYATLDPGIPELAADPKPQSAKAAKWGRSLTVRELAILQGFPREFDWSPVKKTAAYTMIGNAVPPPVARAIAEATLASPPEPPVERRRPRPTALDDFRGED